MLVATGQSFGEGIDNHALRHVIAYCMPKSLEQLMQQTGREQIRSSNSQLAPLSASSLCLMLPPRLLLTLVSFALHM